LFLALGVAMGAGAQVFPPEVVGDCNIPEEGSAWMVPVFYQAPWSAALPDDLGYVVEWDFDGVSLLLHMGPLVDTYGRVRGPALNWYQPSVLLDLDPENCHFRDTWIENGVPKYELWVFIDGEVFWHFGDWEIGHGNLWNFGLIHGVMAASPDAQRVAQIGAAHE
jgi:hypothetical protein